MKEGGREWDRGRAWRVERTGGHEKGKGSMGRDGHGTSEPPKPSQAKRSLETSPPPAASLFRMQAWAGLMRDTEASIPAAQQGSLALAGPIRAATQDRFFQSVFGNR